MPLADLKWFVEPVRQGPGNEECRSVIAWKVGVYAEHLVRGEAGGLWDPTA